MRMDARDLRLIDYIARQERLRHPPRYAEDIEQVARIGAWSALVRAEGRRHGRIAYARSCARGAVLQFLRDKGQLIRVPRWRYEQGYRVPVDQWP